MNNPPAFPTTKPLEGWGDPGQGMSLRDYFAIRFAVKLYPDNPRDTAARLAYELADTMLEARGK